MRKRLTVLVIAALFITLALAQDMTSSPVPIPSTMNYDIRLSILENRMGRVESDLASLSTVPTSLARMEVTLQAVAEKATGAAGVIQTVGLGIVMSVLTSFVVVRSSLKDKKNSSS